VDSIVLALRGAAAVGTLTTLVGGLPVLAQIGLAAAVGIWSAAIAGVALPSEALAVIAAREVVIGATIGVIAAMPLVAAAMAGRLVDGARGPAVRGPYGALFSILAAAVFVGIDGHVVLLTAIVDSFRAAPALASEPRVLASMAALVPIAVRLAIPWLVTAAVVEIAAGVAVRVAGRAAGALPIAAATPAALVMITASLVGTLAVAIATAIRGAL
jgi:flagellar biosynthetic protein FliR